MNTYHYRYNTNGGLVPCDEGLAGISPIQEEFIDINVTDSDCFKSGAFVQDVGE